MIGLVLTVIAVVDRMTVSLTQEVVLSLNKPSNINGEMRYILYTSTS